MWADKTQIEGKLKQIDGLKSGADLISLGWIQRLAVCDGFVRIGLAVAESSADAYQDVVSGIRKSLESMGDAVRSVVIEDASVSQASESSPNPGPMPGVQCGIAVGAGKGGVGKSTISVNLAVGLARRGQSVGLLDGDIYGPSVPTLLGLGGQQATGQGKMIHPFEAHGIKTMTMGGLVDADKPLIWRGPMAHGAFNQLAMQTEWGELDHMIIDLPPGTGDVPLTMAQTLPLRGAIVICTPQKVAQDDAVRAVAMFEQLKVPVLGVIENMSYFIGDDGKEYDLFGRGGAAKMAVNLGLPLLGEIPVHMELRANSDAGNPTANFEGNEQLSDAMGQMIENVLTAIGDGSSNQPTLSVS